jgi:hypothetical protein
VAFSADGRVLESVPSGVYLIRLKVDEAPVSRKVMLLK